MKDLRQSPQYARYLSSLNWIVRKVGVSPHYNVKGLKHHSKLGSIFVYIKKLPVLPFSVMKLQRFEVLPEFEAIDAIAREYRVLSATIEPGIISGMTDFNLIELMNKYRYKKSRWPLLPTKTIRLDLNKNENALLGQMKKDARISIKKARRLCKIQLFSNENIREIERFYKLWTKHGKGSIPKFSDFESLLNAFEKDAFILCGFSKEKELLAGAVILMAFDSAYYYYAATSAYGRSAFAGYLVVWEAIREAKRRGCEIFDLEGIYDERFKHLKRWRGFSLFKKKFGGEEINYPGPFVHSFFSFLIHLLFQFKFNLNIPSLVGKHLLSS